MADNNAELAFLQSMQTEHATGQLNGHQAQQASDEEEEDYDPSSLIPEVSYANAAGFPESNRSSSALSIPQSPVRAASTVSEQKAASASAPVKQPRTMGGFVIDDEDDEDEAPDSKAAVAGSHGLLNVARSSSITPQRSVSQTPINAISSPDVSIHKAAQAQSSSSVVSAGATTAATLAVQAVQPDAGASAQDNPSTKPTQTLPIASQGNPKFVAPTNTASNTKARLPHDRVGMLEDRIADDPRGDMDAWLSLISEHRKRNKFDEARAVYDRFFEFFPSAAEQWVAYANMELENDDFYRLEQIFSKSLLSIPNVQLWSIYLDYVRRRNNLTTDTTGKARQIVNQAYDFVLQNVGIDKDSGQIWQDYISFIRSGAGNIGGTTWQDQQKMDTLRKAYQRAICVPTQAVTALWKQYDSFEMGLNKTTGRKFLQEKSPAYMTARSCTIALENITKDLDRTTLPKLPPALGFDGDVEYMKQVEIWKKWIEWEKEDNLVIKDEDPAAYKSRVIYVYKQALMALRFWPDMWYDAAEFCFHNEMETQGDEFLTQGMMANPESCLLAFKRADRIELSTAGEEGEASIISRGKAVREPYNKVLDALYGLINKAIERQGQAITRLKESFSQDSSSGAGEQRSDEDEDEAGENGVKPKEAALQRQIEAIEKGTTVQVDLLKRTLSFVWIALMRAMRRIQGKGKPTKDKVDGIGGFRQVFADARKRGRITPDVYIASALIEYHCYRDPAAMRIFDKGMTLFPIDEMFALEYLKHLIANNDITNARVIFEKTVSRLTTQTETVHKAKPLYAFFHDYESRYGELSQISKLEKRMKDLYPEDPQLTRFSQRYTTAGFDPTKIRPLISPTTQARPKPLAMPAIIEQPPPPVQDSPRPALAQIPQATNSPKRPFTHDESDNEPAQPRKIPRGESPLKGAAGRRLDAQRRLQQQRAAEATPGNSGNPQALPPAPLPREVFYLLSIIPHASTYKATIFNPQKMVELLRNIDLNASASSQRLPATQTPQLGYGQMTGGYQPYR